MTRLERAVLVLAAYAIPEGGRMALIPHREGRVWIATVEDRYGRELAVIHAADAVAALISLSAAWRHEDPEWDRRTRRFPEDPA